MKARKPPRAVPSAPVTFLTSPVGPSPAPLPDALSTDAELARHRRPYCPHYGGCLDRSVKEEWDGFTCAHCPLRDAAPEAPGTAAFANERRRGTLTP